ncbi:hypothetical protein LGZ99_05745 [Photorhabdus temperata]|uniref:hypothetical protein n=1 Tax=Photorhabdus temperata TaxID=574560 RepID=UPI0021D4BC5D|nr:hypothetical protein [Photorhabdus temperata]MCT8346726.1 hypothetical protein [Photorhabdus temperata]
MIKFFFTLSIWTAIFIPILPKIMILPEVYMYFYDILMVVFFIPILLLKPKCLLFSQSSKSLTMFWLIILFSSLLWSNYIFSPIGLAKIFKGMIYIPLIYAASLGGIIVLKRIISISIISQSLNLIFYIHNLILNGFSIWDAEKLSSGFSNKYFDFSDFIIRNIQGQGAHGIWGTYCAMSLALAFFLWKKGSISCGKTCLVAILSLINIAATVSRESALILILMMFLFFFTSGFRYILYFFITSVALCLISTSIILYFNIDFKTIPIIAKMLYTVHSVEINGNESNISLRLGAWWLIIYSFISQPIFLITGVGYNLELLSFLMSKNSDAAGIFKYVPLPESLFFFSLSFGGIISVFVISIFIFNAFKLFLLDRDSKILVCFLVGLTVANILSGASILSDLVYSQFLMILGYFVGNVKYRNIIALHHKKNIKYY